jgi:hypothetical protein
MKPGVIQVLAVMLMLTACDGKETPVSGTITLTNELYDAGDHYYVLGLSLDEAKAVPYYQGEDRADTWLNAGSLDGGPVVAYLDANTLNPPFSLVGSYDSAGDAKSAFDGLKTVNSIFVYDLAAPLEANQVWVLKTRDFKYAKIRTIEVTVDAQSSPPFASCRFEWVYQPDGTATFP